MRLCRSSILIITCFACVGFNPKASTAISNYTPKILEIAQSSSSTDTVQPTILRFGSKGTDVQQLQTLLLELGYYNGVVDGQYGETTLNAVSKFQTSKGLSADGIAGVKTREILQKAVNEKKATPTPAPTSTPETSKKQKPEQQGLLRWGLLGIGALGIVGALLYLIKTFGKRKTVPFEPAAKEMETETEAYTKLLNAPLEEIDNTGEGYSGIAVIEGDRNFNGSTLVDSQEPPISAKLLPAEATSRLAKVNIIDELIKDLHSPDPALRRKAIWDLGQQGDSRAIQPLVDLMIDVDSQQRSLILSTLAEIGSRTLKPMNRALAISLQDESPEVRQNAIRDLTRVYDMMAQISQMLCHAAEDSDTQVQATARYALSQMNRIRTLPEPEPENEQKD
jgi:peptidoglycan hydrolase-like protein with peptidoglycan-binding domain